MCKEQCLQKKQRNQNSFICIQHLFSNFQRKVNMAKTFSFCVKWFFFYSLNEMCLCYYIYHFWSRIFVPLVIFSNPTPWIYDNIYDDALYEQFLPQFLIQLWLYIICNEKAPPLMWENIVWSNLWSFQCFDRQWNILSIIILLTLKL